jgi:hypothetical protein
VRDGFSEGSVALCKAGCQCGRHRQQSAETKRKRAASRALFNASKLKTPKPEPEGRPCACGTCGELAKPGRRFRQGHHFRANQRGGEINVGVGFKPEEEVEQPPVTVRCVKCKWKKTKVEATKVADAFRSLECVA